MRFIRIQNGLAVFLDGGETKRFNASSLRLRISNLDHYDRDATEERLALFQLENDMNDWKTVRKAGTTEVRDYVAGEDRSKFGVNLSNDNVEELDAVDRGEALPGKVARNPNDHTDQWYIARAFYESQYVEV